MKVLVIIPAKMDSKRLPGKNLQKINGKTLVEHSINYAKACPYVTDIVISSESLEVRQIAIKNDVAFFERPTSLCGDAEVVNVYVDLLSFEIHKVYDYVVCLQPDHPDREHTLTYCLNYMIENNYDDLITIEPSFKRSGSVRIFKYEHLMGGHVSKRIGCIRDSATDIHYEEDLERAKKRLYSGD